MYWLSLLGFGAVGSALGLIIGVEITGYGPEGSPEMFGALFPFLVLFGAILGTVLGVMIADDSIVGRRAGRIAAFVVPFGLWISLAAFG